MCNKIAQSVSEYFPALAQCLPSTEAINNTIISWNNLVLSLILRHRNTLSNFVSYIICNKSNAGIMGQEIDGLFFSSVEKVVCRTDFMTSIKSCAALASLQGDIMSASQKAVFLAIGIAVGAGSTLGVERLWLSGSEEARREAKARADLAEQEARFAKSKTDAETFNINKLKSDESYCRFSPEAKEKWKSAFLKDGHLPNCPPQ